MKVCVVGAGAIGTFLGVHLAKSGCEVAALARGRTLAAVRAAGLRLQQDGALLTAPVRAAEDAAALGRQDLVVVAVKGPSLPAAAALVSPLLGPDTVVLPAMNGVPWWFFHGLGGAHEGRSAFSARRARARQRSGPGRPRSVSGAMGANLNDNGGRDRVGSGQRPIQAYSGPGSPRRGPATEAWPGQGSPGHPHRYPARGR